MFRRFHHGHSAALGFLLALSLQRHALLFAALVFVAGLVAGRAWAVWVDIAHAVKDRLLTRSKAEPVRTRPEPVYSQNAHPGRDGINY